MRQRVPVWLPRARPSGLALRPMRRRDIREVVAIERRSYSVPWSGLTFRSLLRRRNAVMLVAADERQVAGYAALWIAGDEAELGNLAVRPERRSEGIGRRLLERAVEEVSVRGVRALFLEVRESNAVARQLYESAGFRVVAIRQGYYAAPPEDALVMRKTFGPVAV